MSDHTTVTAEMEYTPTWNIKTAQRIHTSMSCSIFIKGISTLLTKNFMTVYLLIMGLWAETAKDVLTGWKPIEIMAQRCNTSLTSAKPM